jgi:8-hydroxy-5-deazaflavin:NADPH oxidoreductase
MTNSDVTTIGFIGSGHIGSTVARLAVSQGYQVIMSNSRDPRTLADLIADLGPAARAATPADAAGADLVVVSIPVKAIGAVPVGPLKGKVVIDTGNYYPERDGRVAEIESGDRTAGELLQDRLPEANVVKAFNNIFFKHLGSLARTAGAGDRSALAIAGDDETAKATVTRFLDRIGYDTVDAGPLGPGSRRFEVGTPAYGAPYGDFSDPAGHPADVATVSAALA